MRNRYDQPYEREYYSDRENWNVRPRSADQTDYGYGRSGWGSARSDYGPNAYGGRLDERGMERDRWRTEDRGFIDRAGDEVRSWFGNEEAERRRRMDEQMDERRHHRERLRQTRWPDEVRARHLMTRTVMCINPDDSVERTARMMRECQCGSIPVVDSRGRFIGMITDRDIAVRLVAQGADTRRARVADCMTNETFACHENDSLEDCLRIMSRHQVRRLPVVDDRNRIVGIISQSDLAQHAGEHPGWGERRAVADMLCAVSEPRFAVRH